MEASASYPCRGSFPSDTNLLVDACIARVRLEARLDDDAVLPPLPRVSPRREVVMMTKSDVAASVAQSSKTGQGASGAEAGDELRKSRALAATQLVSRPRPKSSSRWVSRSALFMCSFVVSAATCAAVLASPVGRRPDVVRATTTMTEGARGHAIHAFHAARSLVR